MVTVELVFGMLIISTVLVIFGWAIMLFAIQIGCVDTATQIARQSARGDQDAVRQAKERAPRNAKISIDDDKSQVTVAVRVTSRPLTWVPSVTVRAESTALKEPGE